MESPIIYLISEIYIYVKERNIINRLLNNYLGRDRALTYRKELMAPLGKNVTTQKKKKKFNKKSKRARTKKQTILFLLNLNR